MGAGVVERSLGGCIDLLLEKHESEFGGQPEWEGGFTSLLSDNFIIANCRCDQAARRSPAVVATGSMSKWSIGSPCRCYPRGSGCVSLPAGPRLRSEPAGLPAVPTLPAAREAASGPGDGAAILLRQRILQFFSQIWPHRSR